MSTSNILGGLLMGMGQGYLQQQEKKEEERQLKLQEEREDAKTLLNVITGILPNVPADAQSQFIELMGGLASGQVKPKDAQQQFFRAIRQTKDVQTRQPLKVPATTTSGGPQLRALPTAPAAMAPVTGGGPVVDAAGLPQRAAPAITPPPAAPTALGLEVAGTPQITTPPAMLPDVTEPMGLFKQGRFEAEQSELKTFREQERIGTEADISKFLP